jgi:transposase InsO family protein
MLFVEVSDDARIACTDLHPDEKRPRAVQYLRDALAYYSSLRVTVRRVLTDNGFDTNSEFRSRDFASACTELGITQRFTRACRPQTNGKAKRFIRLALSKWAYGWSYEYSSQRTRALASWQHHCKWHRSYAGIGSASPMSRLANSRHNLLTVHT